MPQLRITYFSDVLCIWAYVAQARVDAVREKFPEVRLEHRFCNVFGDTKTKFDAAWKDRGGVAGYSRHVLSIAARFSHVAVSPDVWLASRPASSASPHLFLKAVALWERTGVGAEAGLPIFDSVMWAFRRGFFADGRDIGERAVQDELARPFGVPLDEIGRLIDSGAAFAALATDYLDAEKMRIEGSPTFVLNEGRQKLYGNVGFRIVEANIRELLRDPNVDEASWC